MALIPRAMSLSAAIGDAVCGTAVGRDGRCDGDAPGNSEPAKRALLAVVVRSNVDKIFQLHFADGPVNMPVKPASCQSSLLQASLGDAKAPAARRERGDNRSPHGGVTGGHMGSGLIDGQGRFVAGQGKERAGTGGGCMGGSSGNLSTGNGAVGALQVGRSMTRAGRGQVWDAVHSRAEWGAGSRAGRGAQWGRSAGPSVASAASSGRRLVGGAVRTSGWTAQSAGRAAAGSSQQVRRAPPLERGGPARAATAGAAASVAVVRGGRDAATGCWGRASTGGQRVGRAAQAARGAPGARAAKGGQCCCRRTFVFYTIYHAGPRSQNCGAEPRRNK